MKRSYVSEIPLLVNNHAYVCGWVQTVRTHGKIIFIDLRDKTGILQVVFSNKSGLLEQAKNLRGEWVIGVEGLVQSRPENLINKKIETGEIELAAEKLEIFSEAETLPFSVETDGYEISEELRLKYRYLDLRRKRLHENLKTRHQVNNFIRQFLTQKDFVEIETPYITRSTPEGARDFLVPSRLQGGNFYALPQSPQQYKQLLMVAGVEKYFQIARCFRDEDTRGDRQPEFTQLDLEMSFADQEEIMQLNEELLIAIISEMMPTKKIREIPFPRISYREAMEKYGTDRPDMRQDKNDPEELAFCWVVDFPFFEKTDGGKWTFTHNPFSAPKAEFFNDLVSKQNIEKILASQYDIVVNGWEIGGGSIRNHDPQALEAVFDIMELESGSVKRNFGHILEAFSYGAPPHGGIAWGLDRLMMVLQKEPNIRETIAFPKTGDGRDLMMGAPSPANEKQLEELHIKFCLKPSKKQ